ncbi:MAG: outer membrane beta-barrel domain-containing protein [Desulfuromonadaceae bacterium]|nr:outer membrane beta-barrel domain-containing protein [Desulfuromonadaceae bacterium]
MKKILKGTLTSLLLVSLATPGFAENRKGAVTLSPFVGGYVLDRDQREESRPEFGLRAGYNFTENFGAEAMFGYSLTETKQQYGSREADRYRYGVDLLYHFMPDGKFVPFIALGGGGTNFNIPNTPSAENHNAGLVDYGGGVKYFVNPDIALRGDVRHVILVHDIGENNFEYSVGLTFNFGGERKAVAAITDTSAPADTVAPTVFFTSPVNGAPAVPVSQKVNAAFSEPMDPATITPEIFTLKQGNTPVAGKLSSSGSTATFAPSRNFEKGKAYTATVTTGAKDLAGNALTRDYVWDFTAFAEPRVIGCLATLDNSHFDFDSANISENGKTILAANIVVLKNDPTMAIRVAGHTSAAGSEEYNQKLSERRAEAVKDYLVKGGIDANRISTIGYSEKYPAQHEADPSDRLSAAALANMRVVVEIIE